MITEDKAELIAGLALADPITFTYLMYSDTSVILPCKIIHTLPVQLRNTHSDAQSCLATTVCG